MNINDLPDNPYLLLTPGPLSTTKTVKAAMLRDFCTWDDDYNRIVAGIRKRLLALAGVEDEHTATLMQGSGTFAVESVLTTAVPDDGKLLVLSNGAYGRRMTQIAQRQRIRFSQMNFGETSPLDPEEVACFLEKEPRITHVALVHLETTTGMLNPAPKVCQLAKAMGKTVILDAISSFGGIPMNPEEMGVDFLISTSNKCIQGVPGFGFVISTKAAIAQCAGRAKSLSLDLHDQWKTMEENNGKWRFTSPTHVVRAFDAALDELEKEGGVLARYKRYTQSQQRLASGMEALSFVPLLPGELQSPVITAFFAPEDPSWSFTEFYLRLKQAGFVIYPGKVTVRETFRIGNIGHVTPQDMDRLLAAVAEIKWW